jgi:hypothetical protein
MEFFVCASGGNARHELDVVIGLICVFGDFVDRGA